MSKITTDTWIQQFTLFWNGHYVRWPDVTFNLVKGSTNVLLFDHQDSYLSGEPDTSVRLQFAPGMDVQGVNCDPPLGQLTPLVKEEKSIQYTFTLDESTDAGIFVLQFEMPEYEEMPKSPLLPGQVIDAPWPHEFTLRVDDEKKDWSDAHLALVGSGACKLTLDYTGSPLIDVKDAVIALVSESGGGVPNLLANPKFGDSIPMVSGESSMDWIVESMPDADNALFKVKFVMPKLLGMPPSPVLPGQILSKVWEDFIPFFNRLEKDWSDLSLRLVAGESSTVTLRFDKSLLVGQGRSFISLNHKLGEGGDGVVSDPPFGKKIEMSKGLTSLTWTIFARVNSTATGPLSFSLPYYNGIPDSSDFPVVIHSIESELLVEFDKMSVLSESFKIFPCHGANHYLVFRVANDSPLRGQDVELVFSGDNPAKFGMAITADGGQTLDPEVVYRIDCTKSHTSGDVTAQLLFKESGRVIAPLLMSLNHNLVTAEHWRKELSSNPDTPLTEYGIRVKSPFLNRVVEGVLVKVTDGQTSYFTETSSAGEVVRVGTRGWIALRVHNAYDNSDV